MAGHGAADLTHPFLEGQGRPVLGEVVGDVADQALDVALPKQRGRLAHQHGARPEPLQDEAQLGQLPRPRHDPFGLRRIQLHDFRDQQGLAGDRAVLHLQLHPLVHEAFVGGVLVDDHHPVAGLGEDIGFVHLGARRPQGLVEGIGPALLGSLRRRFEPCGRLGHARQLRCKRRLSRPRRGR